MASTGAASEAAIREQAYLLWEQEGRPHGREMEFWTRAKVAVAEKACASPVHPSRSSLWGQSVGMSIKLPFCPHWILCCSLLTRVSEVEKLPVASMSE